MENLCIKYIVDGDVRETSISDEFINLEIEETNRNIIKVTPICKVKIISAVIKYNIKYQETDNLFFNGYQSWTDTKEYYVSEKMRDAKKLPKFLLNRFALDKYGDYTFVDYDKNTLHGFDLFYSKGSNELFIGSYNFKNAFLIIKYDNNNGELSLISDVDNLELNGGESYILFDYMMTEKLNEMDEYFDSFNFKKPDKIFGYTSWYNHYQNIDEKKMLDALYGMDSKFNLFQIDDGYETFVGDWMDVDQNKFPNSLEGIVHLVHEKKMMAGIWVAPFVVEEKSKTFSEHQDWIMKNEDGTLLKAGGNWSGYYPLDLENKEVKEYIKKCFDFLKKIGFDFFKLDFLYVSCLGPSNKTRARRAYESYEFLRECLQGKLILGCGACISSCYGNFDYLRIGPDVSLDFDDKFYMRWIHRERVSTKVTIQNTIYRSIMNGHWFYNDPDVFLLRDDNIKLNYSQKEALLTINSLFGGVLMTSDNIGEYDSVKKELLERAFDLQKNARVLKVSRNKNIIKIEYELHDTVYDLEYNVDKGEVIYG